MVSSKTVYKLKEGEMKVVLSGIYSSTFLLPYTGKNTQSKIELWNSIRNIKKNLQEKGFKAVHTYVYLNTEARYIPRIWGYKSNTILNRVILRHNFFYLPHQPFLPLLLALFFDSCMAWLRASEKRTGLKWAEIFLFLH